MKRADIYIERLIKVATALKSLNEQVVFVGGATVPLLITDEASPDVRPTIDIDVVVEILSQIKFYSFEAELRNLGFTQDTSEDIGSICRYKLGDILIDFMPLSETFLGFSNMWYKLAVKTATKIMLAPNFYIRRITAPCFIATKLAAFENRGNNDYQVSHDIDDIISK